jgi:hypothetical protein
LPVPEISSLANPLRPLGEGFVHVPATGFLNEEDEAAVTLAGDDPERIDG